MRKILQVNGRSYEWRISKQIPTLQMPHWLWRVQENVGSLECTWQTFDSSFSFHSEDSVVEQTQESMLGSRGRDFRRPSLHDAPGGERRDVPGTSTRAAGLHHVGSLGLLCCQGTQVESRKSKDFSKDLSTPSEPQGPASLPASAVLPAQLLRALRALAAPRDAELNGVQIGRLWPHR